MIGSFAVFVYCPLPRHRSAKKKKTVVLSTDSLSVPATLSLEVSRKSPAGTRGRILLDRDNTDPYRIYYIRFIRILNNNNNNSYDKNRPKQINWFRVRTGEDDGHRISIVGNDFSLRTTKSVFGVYD